MNDNNHKINTWHEEAMDFAEMAFFAQRRNEGQAYWKFIQRALNYEKAAARMLKDNADAEPSRSVLYQGAVHLALNLDNFDEARKLLSEALVGTIPAEIREDLENLFAQLEKRERIRARISTITQGYLEEEEDIRPEHIERAFNAAVASVQYFFVNEPVDQLLNRMALKVSLESKNLISAPGYQIFEYGAPDTNWIENRKPKIEWTFWNAYKKYMDARGIASGTVRKLDQLTDDILNRIGDPRKGGIWNKRGMVVGDVQSGKTSNYIGLINKAADAGFRIIIILSGLYENLRQQTQRRVDEGFSGAASEPGNAYTSGVEKFRKPIPVNPVTHTGDKGDVRAASLRNLPLNTNDYYVIVTKKNSSILKNLLTWLHAKGQKDGDFRIIRNIPLLIIDDEADYASINVDKEFVSRINGSIRALLALFEQSAYIGYTATPFANVFISDENKTAGGETSIGQKRFRLGEDIFPKDFIINIPPPSNYIGYTKIFDTSLESGYDQESMPMVNTIDDFEPYIPQKHLKSDDLPQEIPPSLRYAVQCFVLTCAMRAARGQEREHSSMLVHVSWYVNWINHIAGLIDEYLTELKDRIRYSQDGEFIGSLKAVWEKEFKGHTDGIAKRLGYDDPRLIEHSWDEIVPFLTQIAEKIQVRAVHGPQKGVKYGNTEPLNYNMYKEGLSVIVVGGNKLSRGLTLEGLSISYFLRATRFYDTLLQMGRWFGYRPGYADICRLFTTKDLVTWYQYIANATEELKEQFDIMGLAERTPDKFGLKVRSAPGMLMISSAAKIKGATDLNLSYSGELLETYRLSKSTDILRKNLNALKELINKMGAPSGKIRQGQPFIWENVPYNLIDNFLQEYETKQHNIQPEFIRGYISNQLKNGNLRNWTIVVISNSTDPNPYKITTADQTIYVGFTMRKQVGEEKEDKKEIDSKNYIIRKSHIVSPPHEYLDMDETDERYLSAKDDTIKNSKSVTIPLNPRGKYIRKYRRGSDALLLIYVLDPEGFNGSPDLPAVGYAMSLPEIENDEKLPYKVNKQFLEQFDYPADAEENPESLTDA